jgi:2-isopropylmalate synthase
MNSETAQQIEVYDTTLRDGTQGIGVSLSLTDKLTIARALDELGVDYIEGGFPISNPKDEAFFKQVQGLELSRAKICAFGMTRRRGQSPTEDPGLRALLASEAPVLTIVGKTWDLHVDEVLRVARDENLAMIRESLAFCRDNGRRVFYDAEHFFDGYRANPDYALQTLEAALDGGASHLVLCDTNGGSDMDWVRDVVRHVHEQFGKRAVLGIHVHNDGGLAVANTLTAVEAGATQVQGTINGIGERCGNVDLTTVVAHLLLKRGERYRCLRGLQSLQNLTNVSRLVYELANLNPASNQPYVGAGAFAHKGGMHVHAVQRLARSYEHVEPEKVGNTRRVLVSELSGASNIVAMLGEKFNIAEDKELQRQLLNDVQDLENQGYQFEAALASLELLLYERLNGKKHFWNLDHFRCEIYRRAQEPASTQAVVKLNVDGQTEHRVAEGDGPVNALDAALRQCLDAHFPQIRNVHLSDYKVRVVNPSAESAAKVRVVAEFTVKAGEGLAEAVKSRRFSTIGVDENVVNASWRAIADAFRYYLTETGATPLPQPLTA